ncbi:hypothetical protein FISHEDRAFT_76042 [Fistulina hepatica ATCC 64428]|uniref:Uncharacterized protein n=1 Tax=Fistulina hepatica ATCC 64428 TaxID=1128425 RepID=A0A0D7A629_9AGAR|nr:hypothetical protein FISHEDRAFT_76042 [Fistulina hepatica ATCC 64428]
MLIQVITTCERDRWRRCASSSLFTDEQLATAERLAVEGAQLAKEIEEHCYYLRQDPTRLKAAEENTKKQPNPPKFGWMPQDRDQRAEFLRQMQEHREKTPTTFEERYEIMSACFALYNANLAESNGLGYALGLEVLGRRTELNIENGLVAMARQNGTTVEEERRKAEERRAGDVQMAAEKAQRRKDRRSRRQPADPLARPIPELTIDDDTPRPSLTRESVRNMERTKVTLKRGRHWETDEGCSRLHKKIFEYTDPDTGDQTLCQVVGYCVSDQSDQAHLDILFEGLQGDSIIRMPRQVFVDDVLKKDGRWASFIYVPKNANTPK